MTEIANAYGYVILGMFILSFCYCGYISRSAQIPSTVSVNDTIIANPTVLTNSDEEAIQSPTRNATECEAYVVSPIERIPVVPAVVITNDNYFEIYPSNSNIENSRNRE